MKLTYAKADDFSQHGTQEAIFKFFGAHAPRHSLLVDVGAYGRFMSNTYGLLKQGWHGFLIDANPSRIETIKQEFTGLDVEVLNVGIGDVHNIMPLHLHTTVGLDSLLPEWFDQDRNGKTELIQVSPLADVLLDRKVPKDFDLLSVDAEGYDERIFSHMFTESNYRPALIVCESYSFPSAAYLFRSNGYWPYAVCGPPLNGNLVFSRKG